MEDVFKKLVADRHVPVQDTHWAALINAYGCVAKDLDKALQVFESVRTHPSSTQAAELLPGPVTFEALINVLVTLRRTDLIPKYTQQLMESGIHMTAYIANFLIKGYAAAGNLEEARHIFESLLDPPQGIAAPNNHAPHEPSSPAVPADAPVYREVGIV
jgi:pentatricopeptide repeat protein